MTPKMNFACHLGFAALLAGLVAQHELAGLRHRMSVEETAFPAPLALQMLTQPAAPLPVVITPGGRSDQDGATAKRARNGHFFFDTAVNGVRVPMMLDTGATIVAIRGEDAAKVGIDVSALSYTARTRTANGTAEIALVTLDSLTVGNITRRNVSASVARPGQLAYNLLGQSFLARIAGFNVEGDLLILKGGG